MNATTKSPDWMKDWSGHKVDPGKPEQDREPKKSRSRKRDCQTTVITQLHEHRRDNDGLRTRNAQRNHEIAAAKWLVGKDHGGREQRKEGHTGDHDGARGQVISRSSKSSCTVEGISLLYNVQLLPILTDTGKERRSDTTIHADPIQIADMLDDALCEATLVP